MYYTHFPSYNHFSMDKINIFYSQNVLFTFKVKWLFIWILKGYVYTTKNKEYHSNLFYESLASSLALLEDTTAPLRSGMCTAPPQLPQTFIYALLETRGKKSPSCSSTSHLWEPTAHVYSTHQLFLSQKTTGLKALALNPKHSPYD